MRQTYARSALILIGMLLIPGVAAPQAAQRQKPYTLDQLVRMVESGLFTKTRILSLVDESCLGFVLDDRAARRLRAAGASEDLVEALEVVCVTLPAPVDTIAVSRTRLALQVGDTMPVTARPLAADSSEVEGAELTWSSSDTTIATVMPNGVITAVGPGATQVTVRSPDGPRSVVAVRVADPAMAAADTATGVKARRGKSVGTAAALGVVFPGGGEFYAGNRTKGIIVTAGAAAALAAGYLIKTEDPIGEPTFQVVGQCTPSSCEVLRVQQVEETRQLVIGAAVAGAFWLYGLVDGIRSAGRDRRPALREEAERPAAAVQLLPLDGVRHARGGGLDVTLVRVRP